MKMTKILTESITNDNLTISRTSDENGYATGKIRIANNSSRLSIGFDYKEAGFIVSVLSQFLQKSLKSTNPPEDIL